MKLRYYMRGLGVGIAVTAIIMGIINKPETLSDAEIKLRASKLGMVENGVLAKVENSQDEDDNKNQQADNNDIAKDENIDIDEAAKVPEEALDKTNEINEKDLPDTAVSDENIQQSSLQSSGLQQDNNTTPEDGSSDIIEITDIGEAVNPMTNSGVQNESVESVENYVIVTIESGNAAQTISKKLAEAGLVESASDYSDYLSLNGYSKMLRVGQHEIPMGAGYEQIARILCELD